MSKFRKFFAGQCIFTEPRLVTYARLMQYALGQSMLALCQYRLSVLDEVLSTSSSLRSAEAVKGDSYMHCEKENKRTPLMSPRGLKACL